jgi:hypothetical protein
VASDDLEVHRLRGVVDVPLVRSCDGELHASWPIDLAVWQIYRGPHPRRL